MATAVLFILIRLFYTAKNYEEPDSPRFSGNFAPVPPEKSNEITVVSYNIRYAQNFGTAVLAKWPILESAKLILPHKSFTSGLNRSATKATIMVNDLSILVYSVHTETIFTLPAYRRNQFTAVLADSGPDAEYVIVGGDFNTVNGADVARLEGILGNGRFVRASAESGFTLIKSGLEVEADHIFSKGLPPQSTGKIADATASDHLPIWVTLSLP